MTYDETFKEALAVQDACNLSGVVFAFSRAMEAICKEASEKGYGTEWKNRHPVSKLFADKITMLAFYGGAHDLHEYSKAYDECKERTV